MQKQTNRNPANQTQLKTNAEKRDYIKRKLDEMNLLDDFLFGTLVSYPELGEQFSRILLKTIFKKDFGRLKVIPQKVFYGEDTVWHQEKIISICGTCLSF